MTSVILWGICARSILGSPTTEPGRRGWEWRLGSLLSAPIFLSPNLTPSCYSTRTFVVKPFRYNNDRFVYNPSTRSQTVCVARNHEKILTVDPDRVPCFVRVGGG